jgi:hypothetical protein
MHTNSVTERMELTYSKSIYQIATQYVICSLTNDPERLARYAGVFRGVTAFGMMFSFIIDGNGGSYIAELSFQFACYFVGICLLYVVSVFYITDSNYFHEETVIVPHHVEEEVRQQKRLDHEDGTLPGPGKEADIKVDEEGDAAGTTKP